MEIVGIFIFLAFMIGTIAIIAICSRWISAHFLEWNRLIKFTLKTLCLIAFLMLFLITISQSMADQPQQLASTLSAIYIILIAVLGLYTFGRDYYLFFRKKKR